MPVETFSTSRTVISRTVSQHHQTELRNNPAPDRDCAAAVGSQSVGVGQSVLTLARAAVDGVSEEARLADVTVLAGSQVAARLARAVAHVTRAVTVTLARCGGLETYGSRMIKYTQIQYFYQSKIQNY